jgi:hypothetical protein
MHGRQFESIASRRDYLLRAGFGAGAAALSSLLTSESSSGRESQPTFPNFPAKAKRIICLF